MQTRLADICARIRRRTLDFFAYEELGAAFVLVMLVHVGQMLFTSPKGTFLSTLLFRSTGGSTEIVKLYNIITYLSECIGTFLAIWIIRRKGAVFSIRAGLLVFLAAYVSFFIFFQSIGDFMALIGLLMGVGTGLYWSAYYLYITEYSSDSTRDIALAAVGVCTSIISFIVPGLCGWVISAFAGLTGYLVVFAGALLIAVLIVLLSTKLDNHMVPDRRSHYREALGTIFTQKVWFSSVFTEFLRGLRDGAFAFFLNLLLFQFIQNEALVGFNTVLAGLAAIFANWVMRKTLRPHNRVKMMLIATSALLCSGIALFFGLNPVTLIIMSVINSFFSGYIYNPSLSIFLTLLDTTRRGKAMRLEFLAIKNHFLSFGRIVGVVLTLVLPNTNAGNVTAICALTAFQFLTAFFAARTVRLMEKEQELDALETSPA